MRTYKFWKRLLVVIIFSSVVLALAHFLASIVSHFSIISANFTYRQIFSYSAIISCLAVSALYLLVKFWPSWYRRLAITITTAILGSLGLSYVPLIYDLLGKEPPLWVREWFAPLPGEAVAGGFVCIAVLAVLDFFVKHGHTLLKGGYELQNKNSQKKNKAAAKRAREAYLASLEADVKNRLEASIHGARLVDLDITDSPEATHLPWVYQHQDSDRQFCSIEEAINKLQNRLLILGAPGSGKSTTLLTVGKQLIDVARSDPTAPMPVIVNLSRFRAFQSSGVFHKFFGSRKVDDTQRGEKIIDWLADELENFRGVSLVQAKTWLEQGELTFLLDGLDEVDDTYRAELVDLLNSAFFQAYPTQSIIVCSRIDEYLPFQERKETRLQLEGAVTLKPLNAEQVQEYLKEAQAPQLISALEHDEVLREMAETPLTLSMMVFAYGSAHAAELSKSMDVTERRHQLMEQYIERMLQRSERRRAGIPFDENEDNDVPVAKYKYSPQQVDRYLGWLALRMSVRMQTSFSMSRFYSFLVQDIERDQKSAAPLAVNTANGFILVLFLAFAGLFIGPHDPAAWALKAGIAAAAFLLCFVPGEGERYVPKEQRKKEWGLVLFVGIAVLLWPILLGVASVSAAHVVGLPTYSIEVGVFSILFTFIIIFGGAGILNDEPVGWIAFWGAIGCIAIGVASAASGLFAARAIMGVTITIMVVVAVIISEVFSYVALMIGAVIVVGVYLFLIFGVGIATDYFWLGLFALIAFFGALLSLSPPAFYFFIIYALIVFIILKEYYASVFLIYGSAYVLILYSFTERGLRQRSESLSLSVKKGPTKTIPDIEDVIKGVGGRIIHMLEPLILSYIARGKTAAIFLLPMQFQKFQRYTHEAMLLKPAGAGVEFYHRTIRDHFALRELRPLFRSPDRKQQLEAVRSLGYQGEAAIETLVDFAKNARVDVRNAAAFAFGRMASPTVVQYLEALTHDPDEVVRATALASAVNFPTADINEMVKRLLLDHSSVVQCTILEVCLVRGEHWFRPSSRNSDDSVKNTVMDQILTTLRQNTVVREHLASLIMDPATVKNKYLRYLDVYDAYSIAGALKHAQLVKPLKQALLKANGTKYQQSLIVDALLNIGGQEAVDAIKGCYLTSNNRELRTNILSSLRVSRAAEAKALLSELVSVQPRGWGWRFRG